MHKDEDKYYKLKNFIYKDFKERLKQGFSDYDYNFDCNKRETFNNRETSLNTYANKEYLDNFKIR